MVDINKIPTDETILSVSSHLEVMGNPTRLKIMYFLKEEELGVLELSELLNMSMPAISHHLRVLKDKMIVTRRQEGKNVYYRLEDPCLIQVLEVAKIHVEEHHR
ncbi:MAG: winged helix-turn-helix transcriptional regulator [Spirochaetales bacterium]|nr:winged helix-turn-helix transcriptional regulator [Spirochaetales bacterium]